MSAAAGTPANLVNRHLAFALARPWPRVSQKILRVPASSYRTRALEARAQPTPVKTGRVIQERAALFPRALFAYGASRLSMAIS
jgi:hypothetical protein